MSDYSEQPENPQQDEPQKADEQANDDVAAEEQVSQADGGEEKAASEGEGSNKDEAAAESEQAKQEKSADKEAEQEEHDGGEDDHSDSDKGKGKSSSKNQRLIMVRYGKMGNVGLFRHAEREIPFGTTHVVVKTERGMEIGEIISSFCHKKGFCQIPSDQMDGYYNESGPNYPVTRHGTLVRFATENDMKDLKHIRANIRDLMDSCQKLVDKQNLEMKLIDAEHLFGGERIIFYFMADGRVDFRSLVKELAHQFQTRIEMRQVGARDEARLVGDFETCGRECCCKNFLKVLQPVNMRMAKLQKATLDPSKISGRCGRLKCCLRFEDQVYTELYKKLPRRNTCVLTEKGYATVLDGQVLTQLVKVRLEPSGRVMALGVDELLETNCKMPTPEEVKALAEEKERQARVEAERQRAEMRAMEDRVTGGSSSTDASESKDAKGDSKDNKNGQDGQRSQRRRPRRRRPNRRGGQSGGGNAQGGGDNQGQQKQGNGGPSKPQQQGQGGQAQGGGDGQQPSGDSPAKKRRRRRRRKKKPSGEGGGGGKES